LSRRACLLVLLLSARAAAEGPFALRSFPHERHAKRSGERACATCHEGPPATSPPPEKDACLGCHDGQRAFSTVEPACRRCHAAPRATVALPPLGRPAGFTHATAAHALPCARCHTLDAAGHPRPPAVRHAPCADAGCHADDFRAASPRTCTVCHVGSEPWRPLAADAPRRVRSEFGVELAHATHDVVDCARCHTGIRGGPAMRLGQGHDTCGTAGCHAGKLDACTSCHIAGLLPARDARRQGAAWSVARRFRHETHGFATCTSCHTDVPGAATIAAIAAPKKPTCAPCHDGGQAFKMTGHGCARCHGQ
jgi:Cytochrome c7 and related cytochrome c